MEKILFATKIARPDTGTAISYLETRVREPDEENWSKLKHLMNYNKGKKEFPMILGEDETGMLKHPNLIGHSGGSLCVVRGLPIPALKKHNLNTQRSIESEIVGVNDFMPGIIWKRRFLKAQDYGVTNNINLQDNKSTLILENIGKESSGKITNHINISSFVTDRIQRGEVPVEWCLTIDINSGLFTKTNKRSLLRMFRDMVMGGVVQLYPGLGNPNNNH